MRFIRIDRWLVVGWLVEVFQESEQVAVGSQHQGAVASQGGSVGVQRFDERIELGGKRIFSVDGAVDLRRLGIGLSLDLFNLSIGFRFDPLQIAFASSNEYFVSG